MRQKYISNLSKRAVKSFRNRNLKWYRNAFQKFPREQLKSFRNGNKNWTTVKVQWLITYSRWLPKGQWNYRGKWDTGKTCTFGSQNISSAFLKWRCIFADYEDWQAQILDFLLLDPIWPPNRIKWGSKGGLLIQMSLLLWLSQYSALWWPNDAFSWKFKHPVRHLKT